MSVKPRFEDSLEQDADGDAIDWELRLSSRVWVGYQHPSGYGFRGRYWQHHRQSIPAVAADHFRPVFDTAIMTIEVHAIDIDFLQLLECGCLRQELGFGVRYATFDEDVRDGVTGREYFKSFQGFGPSFSYHGEIPVPLAGFRFYGSARGSVLFARSGWGERPSPWQDGDDMATVVEGQVGCEWSGQFFYGGTIAIRTGFDVQNWMGMGTTFDDDGTVQDRFFATDPDDHDIGFLGFVIGLAISS